MENRSVARRGRINARCAAFALLAVISLPGTAIAEQDPCALDLAQYRLQSWSTDDGLPLDSIHAIALTPDGFLWVGTESGFARFGGRSFDRDLPTRTTDAVPRPGEQSTP